LVGTAQTLKFQGENETIDRRAMVFASKGDKKKKDEEKKDDGAKSEEKKEAPAESDSAKSEAPAEDTKPTSDDNAPPPVEGKPGGCGCKLAGGERSSANAVWALAGAAVFFARRRRALKAA
jgi:MYXO-CTERM domain-containing protein